MSEAGASERGPAVDANENLLRFITTPSFWVSAAQRPSSAAIDKDRRINNCRSRSRETSDRTLTSSATPDRYFCTDPKSAEKKVRLRRWATTRKPLR